MKTRTVESLDLGSERLMLDYGDFMDPCIEILRASDERLLIMGRNRAGRVIVYRMDHDKKDDATGRIINVAVHNGKCTIEFNSYLGEKGYNVMVSDIVEFCNENECREVMPMTMRDSEGFVLLSAKNVHKKDGRIRRYGPDMKVRCYNVDDNDPEVAAIIGSITMCTEQRCEINFLTALDDYDTVDEGQDEFILLAIDPTGRIESIVDELWAPDRNVIERILGWIGNLFVSTKTVAADETNHGAIFPDWRKYKLVRMARNRRSSSLDF